VQHHLIRISTAERDHRREDLPAAEIWDLAVETEDEQIKGEEKFT
jgi:hypothetical protein